MALLPQSIADAVALDGLPRVATADDTSQHVLYLDGETVRSKTAAEWGTPLPSDPTPEQISAAVAAREAARQQASADAATLRQQVLTIAQSAVGIRADLLTAAQLRALFVVMLWKEGALDNALIVRPLTQWVKG